MFYSLIKQAHISLVIVSVSGFIIRSIWMITGSSVLKHRATRILPHLIDSLLLISGIYLMVVTQQFPFADPWLTSKLTGLVVYILLGSIALKRGSTPSIRIVALLSALLVIGWMVSVALLHSPLGFIELLHLNRV